MEQFFLVFNYLFYKKIMNFKKKKKGKAIGVNLSNYIIVHI